MIGEIEAVFLKTTWQSGQQSFTFLKVFTIHLGYCIYDRPSVLQLSFKVIGCIQYQYKWISY